MEELVAIINALASVRLEAVFIGDGAQQLRAGVDPDSVELLVRDTPLHRRRVSLFAQAIHCGEVPLSQQARTIALVGAKCRIDIVFGRTPYASFGRIRATAQLADLNGAQLLLETRHGKTD
jgi:hypothetical protein